MDMEPHLHVAGLLSSTWEELTQCQSRRWTHTRKENQVSMDHILQVKRLLGNIFISKPSGFPSSLQPAMCWLQCAPFKHWRVRLCTCIWSFICRTLLFAILSGCVWMCELCRHEIMPNSDCALQTSSLCVWMGAIHLWNAEKQTQRMMSCVNVCEFAIELEHCTSINSFLSYTLRKHIIHHFTTNKGVLCPQF